MLLQVKGRNLEVSDQIRAYAEDKLGKLDRLVKDPTRIELELAVEKNPSISDNQVAEATVWTKGPVLRARESSEDMKASIDQLVDKLERQVKRYREKRRPRKHDRPADAAQELVMPEVSDEGPPVIVKTKQFAVQADDARRGDPPARARRPRLLRVPKRRIRRDQRRLPAARRELRADRAFVVGLFRRGEPIHEKLAREGGLDLPRGVNEVTGPPVIDPRHPLWQVAGIHGIPRVREWDAVTSAVCARAPG